ncbi:MAG: hypothetical protein AAF666_04810 [Pseudomonadota bacterium]
MLFLFALAYGLSALVAVVLHHAGIGAWPVVLTFWLGGALLVFALPLSARLSPGVRLDPALRPGAVPGMSRLL